MKLKKSDVNLLLIVFGLLAVVATYFFVFTKFNTKTEEINANNAVLKDEVSRLEELENNRPEYEALTAEWKADMDAIKAQFDASYLPEDEILYVDNLEKTFAADAASISMPGSNLVDVPYTPAGVQATTESAPAEAPEGEDGETVQTDIEAPSQEPPVRLYATPVSISYKASYDSLKSLLTDMNEDDMRKSIDNVTMAFDGETGDLTGSMAFTMYSMTGTDAEYEIPSVSGVSFGTNNIFNSSAKGAAIKAEKAQQASDAESAGNE